MKTDLITLPLYSRTECVYLRGFFDIHHGTKNCDVEQLKKDIEWVRKRPNAYAFLGGDMIEAINMSDKRFDMDSLENGYQNELDNLAMAQANGVIDLFMPIKKKILFSLTGNHEEKVRRNYHFDAARYIAGALKTKYYGQIALVRIRLERRTKGNIKMASKNIIMAVSHSPGGMGGGKPGGKINKLLEMGSKFEADIYWAGHVHENINHKSAKLGITKSGIPILVPYEKRYIVGGTYLKTYQEGNASYGETALYSPTSIGSVVLKIIPFEAREVNGKIRESGIRFSIEDTGQNIYGSE